MYGCNLNNQVFNERVSYSSCSIIIVISSTFSDIHSNKEGGALFVSTNGQLEVNESTFLHCSTTNVAGALSCSISGLVIDCACFFDCFGTSDISSNTFHALKIYSAGSGSWSRISQSSYCFCPNDPQKMDETVGFRSSFLVRFVENNFTKNLENEEMLTYDTDVKVDGSMIHCVSHGCVSGYLLFYSSDTIVESCNIINNEPNGGRHQLIRNGGKIILKECVITNNSHPTIFVNSNSDETISCFFCNNAFDHIGNDICVPSLKLSLRDAESCKKGSYRFTNNKDQKIPGTL